MIAGVFCRWGVMGCVMGVGGGIRRIWILSRGIRCGGRGGIVRSWICVVIGVRVGEPLLGRPDQLTDDLRAAMIALMGEAAR